jgi:hypothetical protein
MVGFLNKLKGAFNALTNTRELKQCIDKLEQEKVELDKRADELARATLNGDEDWFVSTVRKDPVCAMKVLKECER